MPRTVPGRGQVTDGHATHCGVSRLERVIHTTGANRPRRPHEPVSLRSHAANHMPFQETEPHDLVAAYALDAVDDEERMAFERHLESCEQCRTELVTLRDTAASLAYAPGAVSPPPQLRGRILDSARDERTNVVPLHRRSRTTWALGAATAIAAGIAIARGVWIVSRSNSLDEERSTSAA